MIEFCINYFYALGDILQGNILYIGIGVLIFVSLILFTLSKRKKINIIVFLIIYFFSIFSLIIYFVINLFSGGEGINDATIFLLRYGLQGASVGEFWPASSVSFGILILSVCLFIIFNTRLRKVNRVYNVFPYGIIILSLISNPIFKDIYNQIIKEEVLFVKEKVKDNDFKDFYKVPELKQKLKNKKVVVIYLESLERTYLKKGLFPGLLSGIESLEKKSISFVNLGQAPKTGYTIAGMVASQLGIPLRLSSGGNTMKGIDYFLPGANGLGDILSNSGYHLCFYHGGKLSFAGINPFHKTHNFNEVIGYNSLKKYLPSKNYQSTWGLYDDTMFDLAYKKYISLAEKYDKFALFLLTIDTHFSGHIIPEYKNMKYREGNNHTLNVLKIEDYLVSKFINNIFKSPYRKDTVVILLSDHLSMGNDVINILKKNERRNLCVIISPDIKKGEKINTYGSMLDIAPTILSYLGGEGNVGLGRNLFDNTAKTKEERSFIRKNLHRWRFKIEEFWNYPSIKEKIVVFPKNKYVLVDNRKFLIPVLITFNKNFDTKIMFNFAFNKKLTEVNQIWNKNNDYFVLIDQYKNIDKILKSSKINDKYCILYGKGNKYYKLEPCEEKTEITRKELADYFGIK